MDKIKSIFKGMNNKSKIFYLFTFVISIIALITGFKSGGITISNVLFNKDDVFMDFFNSVHDCAHGVDAYTAYGVIYPPLIILFYRFFSYFFPVGTEAKDMRDSSIGMLMFFIVTAACLYILIKCINKYKDGNKADKALFFITILMSIPMLYLIERGNILLLVISLLLVYLYGYDSEDKKTRHIAYICLAISVSIKLYPVIFGILLIRKKDNIKNIITCVIYGILFFFVPFFFVGGPKQLFTLINNILYTSSMFANKGFGFKVNATNTFGMVGDLLHHSYIFESLGNATLIIIAVVGILLVMFGKFANTWKMWAILSLFQVLVPGFSYVYAVAYMIVPLIAFLNDKKKRYFDIVYLVLFVMQFAFFFARNAEFFDSFEGSELALNISTIIESLSLLAMTFLLYAETILYTLYKLKGAKTPKLHIYVRPVIVIALAVIVAGSGAFAIKTTPTKSGFSITSVECFQIDENNEEDTNALNEFYQYADDNFGDQKVVAFPKVDFIKPVDEKHNVKYYDMSYYDSSIKSKNAIIKYDPDYLVIYNAVRYDIRQTIKQVSNTEVNSYMAMLKDITQIAWDNGYIKCSSHKMTNGIELSVWCKKDENSGKLWTDGGNGEYDNPFVISKPEQFKYFAEFVNAGHGMVNKYIVLKNDIDMSGIDDFEPIASEFYGHTFKGTFNGNGHTIKNLTINKEVKPGDVYNPKQNAALFGLLAGNVVNLVVEDCSFNGYNVATIARASASKYAIVMNCLVKNNNLNGVLCGEIVGEYYGTATSCISLNNKVSASKGAGVTNTVSNHPLYTQIFTNNKEQFKFENNYISKDMMLNQEFVDSLNYYSNDLNKQRILNYNTRIHKLCYNGDKEIKELAYRPDKLPMTSWSIQNNEFVLTK